MRLLLAALTFLLSYSVSYASCELTPTIGVSGQSPTSRTVVPIMTVLRTLGAEVIYLDQYKGRDPAKDIHKLDAIIIAGNSEDIDPARYGQEPHPKTKTEKSPLRGIYEYNLIEQALAKHVPMLGICGGLQRINLSGDEQTRGSLKQHVEDQNQGIHEPPIPPYIPTERITITRNTTLEALMPDERTRIEVNSYHHQVPDKVRDGFRATAKSEYGTIEAIEPTPTGPYADQFVLGVMWHPEFSADELSKSIMKRLVDEARLFACRKQNAL
ncbi:MAG: gamma-glutamyl-gamma-aminobutyrate hydrolase family protein [Rickettsiales bacterium]|nr:gamma-glutamyl-gamma-aminobutyrate hydrolase family protein [Rickettsiales bacterium]